MKTRNFLFWSGLLLFLTTCKKEPEPDLCKDLMPVTADFKIEEVLPDLGAYETDTALTYKPITITALENYDSYEWKVGTDPTIRTEKSFNIGFTEAVGKIDIRLIAKRTPNLECFPNDNGIDTLTKSLYISEWANSPIIGDYEGYVVGKESDKFIVSIKYNGCNFVLQNLNKGCVGILTNETPCLPIKGLEPNCGGRAMSFESYVGYGCDAPRGNGFLKKGDKNTIEIEYQKLISPNYVTWISEKFIGKRIN